MQKIVIQKMDQYTTNYHQLLIKSHWKCLSECSRRAIGYSSDEGVWKPLPTERKLWTTSARSESSLRNVLSSKLLLRIDCTQNFQSNLRNKVKHFYGRPCNFLWNLIFFKLPLSSSKPKLRQLIFCAIDSQKMLHKL